MELDNWIECTVKVTGLIPRPKKVIVSNNVTVVIWDDGSKTRSTCAPDDHFDPVVGMGQCLMKKIYGKRKIASMLKKVEYQRASKAEIDIPF